MGASSMMSSKSELIRSTASKQQLDLTDILFAYDKNLEEQLLQNLVEKQESQKQINIEIKRVK